MWDSLNYNFSLVDFNYVKRTLQNIQIVISAVEIVPIIIIIQNHT